MRQLIFSLTSLFIMHISERESIPSKNIFFSVATATEEKKKKLMVLDIDKIF